MSGTSVARKLMRAPKKMYRYNAKNVVYSVQSMQ